MQKVSSAEAKKIRLFLILSLLFIFISTYLSPSKLIRNFLPGIFHRESNCLLLNITGIPCPFCGMTRSFEELIKFNFMNTFYYNPSSVFIFTFLASISLVIFVLSVYNYKISINSGRKTFIAFAAVLLTVWIINIIFGHY